MPQFSWLGSFTKMYKIFMALNFSWKRIFVGVGLVVLPLGFGSCAGRGGLDNLPPPLRPELIEHEEARPNVAFLPGDTVELYVDEDATLNGVYGVRGGGYIVIPRVGRIPVAGLDRDQAEKQIQSYLQRGQLTNATVLVERNSARRSRETQIGGPPGVPKVMLFITGSVPKSGVHYVPVPAGHQLGVYEALMLTGGMGRFAKNSHVELFRMDATGKRHQAKVDLRPIRDGKTEDVPVGEGDIVNVPERVFGF